MPGGEGVAPRSFSLLLPVEPGRRNRRTIDGLLVGTGAILAGLAAVAARSAPGVDEDVGQGIETALGWAPGIWRAALVGALALALVVVVDAVLRKRWLLVRDVAIALVVVNVVGSLLARVVDSQWLQVEPHVLSHWGFPELRLASAIAVFAVARPDLVRPVWLLTIWVGGLASIGSLALGVALPSEVLGGLALGLGAGALVRLALGSRSEFRPSIACARRWARSASKLSSCGSPNVSAWAPPSTSGWTWTDDR